MNLFENGYDSFKKAITKYNNLNCKNKDYEYELKDVIIFLHHSTEVLIKYILSTKNEMLIYADIEQYCNNKLDLKPKNNLNTISFIDAIKRYLVISHDYSSKDYITYYKELNNLRNSITHFNFTLSENDVEHILSILIPHIYTIIATEISGFRNGYLEDDLEQNINKIRANTWEHDLKSFLSLIKKIHAAISVISEYDENKANYSQVYSNKVKTKFYDICPLCKQELLMRKGTTIVNGRTAIYFGNCLFCRTSLDIDELFLFNRLSNFNELSSKTEIELIKEDENHLHRELSKSIEEYCKSIGAINIFDSENKPISQRELNSMMVYFIENYYEYGYSINDEDIKIIREVFNDKNLKFAVEHRLGKVIRNDIYEVAEELCENIEKMPKNEFGWYRINHLTNEGKEYVKSLINGYQILSTNASSYIDGFIDMTFYGENQIEICYSIRIDDFQ